MQKKINVNRWCVRKGLVLCLCFWLYKTHDPPLVSLVFHLFPRRFVVSLMKSCRPTTLMLPVTSLPLMTYTITGDRTLTTKRHASPTTHAGKMAADYWLWAVLVHWFESRFNSCLSFKGYGIGRYRERGGRAFIHIPQKVIAVQMEERLGSWKLCPSEYCINICVLYLLQSYFLDLLLDYGTGNLGL